MSTPNRGTAFSDGVSVGSFRSAQFNYGNPGLNIGSRRTYAFCPQNQTNISAAVTLAGAGFIPTTNALLSPANVTYQGYTGVTPFDCARSVYVTPAGDVGNDVTITVSGWDIWGNKVVSTAVIPNGTSDNPTFPKTFLYIKSVYVTPNTGGVALTMSTGCNFGFPWYVPDATFALIQWQQAPTYGVQLPDPDFVAGEFLPLIANTVGNYMIGSGTFTPGDTTNPATALSDDPRGWYAIQTGDDDPQPNSTTWLTMDIYVPGFDGMQGTVVAPAGYPNAPDTAVPGIQPPSQNYCYGVPQYTTGWQ